MLPYVHLKDLQQEGFSVEESHEIRKTIRIIRLIEKPDIHFVESYRIYVAEKIPVN